jgi:hypothetical protein
MTGRSRDPVKDSYDIVVESFYVFLKFKLFVFFKSPKLFSVPSFEMQRVVPPSTFPSLAAPLFRSMCDLAGGLKQHQDFLHHLSFNTAHALYEPKNVYSCYDPRMK